ALAADAVKAVAAGDEVAGDLLHVAADAVGYARTVAEDVVHADVAGGVDGLCASDRAAVHEVAGDLGLSVDHHRLAGELLERDSMADTVDANLHARVHETVAVHAAANAGFVEKIARDLLDDARADAAQHIFGGLPFQDDVVDAAPVQQLAEEQAGGA